MYRRASMASGAPASLNAPGGHLEHPSPGEQSNVTLQDPGGHAAEQAHGERSSLRNTLTMRSRRPSLSRFESAPVKSYADDAA